MKAVFFIKMNNQTRKLREEDIPPGLPTDVDEIMCIIAFTFNDNLNKVPKLCKFRRIVTSLGDVQMFVHDADKENMPLDRGPIPITGV